VNDHDPPYAIARTTAEAMLYLDLTACPDCGSDDAVWQRAIDDGALRYVGACAHCGAEREYLFSPPYQGLLDDVATFGGPEPSELVDAGQWLAIADAIAGEVPADVVRLVGQARVIAGPARRQEVVADALAVDEAAVEAERADAQLFVAPD